MEQTFTNTEIPKGSWVLVTGVNGYVASHTADQLLQHGYRVRGTVRNLSKNQWVEDLFREKYGVDRFELVQVEDMTVPDAFDQAVKGVSGVAHVATILGHRTDLITSVIDTNRNLLVSAAREDTITRFVYTSSSEAATFSSFLEHQAGKSTQISVDTWNEVVSIFRKAFPDRELPRELPGTGETFRYEIGPDARAQDILRAMGKSGWSSLEDSLMANVSDML
ncbi:hypothetical protein ASPBRDRAFT_31688 [Aspergillus brasiliensis CBS 101740]|uniref:NAD-dependent epimerase/dehydratase domain-containing protein n=1 Tax=Aspergillus brasiliensis (strain CBS 101740 / IMI 381727 / IBT 21946) TaxID=767769 RepID=A0A1L9UDQ4_ASPBC|nr:hypothetical protein ASPBRDRAFT_31688 [Aspergillus brasiliensis CBS 101740]